VSDLRAVAGPRPEPLLRLRAQPGAAPIGAIFLGIGVLAAAAIELLHLDRLPFSVCFLKAATGIPCPTCGSTRAFAHLATLDFAGAFAMNPLAALGAVLIAAWGLAELALLPRKSALVLDVSPALAPWLRRGVIAILLVNWAWLVAAGR
jgi:Protein of unknown function (DUF2752)